MATGDEGRLVRQRVQAALKQKTNQEWDLFFRDKDCTVEIGTALGTSSLPCSFINIAMDICSAAARKCKSD